MYNNTSSLLTKSMSCIVTVAMLTSCYATSISVTESTECDYTEAAQQPNEEIKVKPIIETIEVIQIPAAKEMPTNLSCVDIEEEVIETYLMYVDASAVYYRSEPEIDQSTALGLLRQGDEVDVIEQEGQWCKCIVNDEEVYIHSTLLTEEIKSTSIVTATITDEEVPLSASLGRIQGPSGEETYYNLNMKGCVERMKSLGYDYEYWIRDDGVKMFGNYVMVAANFELRPLGTIIETSLGFGIVVDTGEFVNENPTQLDIAVTW